MTPSRSAKLALARARSATILVRSTSWVCVSCAVVCSDSRVFLAVICRIRLAFCVVPRRCASAGRRGAALAAGAAAAAAGAGAAGCGCLLGLGGGEHVLLADAAADAGALDRGQVDAVLRGQLAHQRGDVRAAVGATGIGRGRRGRRRGFRLRLGLGFRLRLGLRLRPWAPASGSALGSGFGLGLRFGLGFGLGRRGRALGADLGELAADGDGVVLLGGDRQQGARDRRRDLGVDLVGGHLDQRLVDLDAVADLLQPAGDGALGDRLAQLGHHHRGRLTAAGPRRPQARSRARALIRALARRSVACSARAPAPARARVRAPVPSPRQERSPPPSPASPICAKLAADLDGVVLLGDDLGQDARGG